MLLSPAFRRFAVILSVVFGHFALKLSMWHEIKLLTVSSFHTDFITDFPRLARVMIRATVSFLFNKAVKFRPKDPTYQLHSTQLDLTDLT